MFPKRTILSLLTLAGLVLAAGATQAGARPANEDLVIAPTGLSDVVPAARYVVATTGNEVRYRLRERLVGMELPYDAVGVTDKVTGSIALDDNGAVVAAESRLVIDVTGLTSDKDRRDGYVQRRLLETETHPTVTFVPTALRGLPATLPTTGEHTFQMVGNLTVKGVTRPTTWNVTARFQGGRITGNAFTEFTFDDFSMEKPAVSVILTLADTIRLEYDFTLQQAT